MVNYAVADDLLFFCSDDLLFFTRRRISETRQQFINAIAVDVFRVGDSFTSVLFMEDYPQFWVQKSQNNNFRDIFKWRLNRSAAARTLRGSQPVAVGGCQFP